MEEKGISSTLVMAIEKRRETGKLAESELYEFICKHPGYSIYDYAKKMGWSYGKTQRAIERLLEEELIKHKEEREGTKIKKLVYPLEMSEIKLEL